MINTPYVKQATFSATGQSYTFAPNEISPISWQVKIINTDANTLTYNIQLLDNDGYAATASTSTVATNVSTVVSVPYSSSKLKVTCTGTSVTARVQVMGVYGLVDKFPGSYGTAAVAS